MSFLGQVFPNQEILADRYQLKNIIGKGGMGTVYEAADTLLGGVKLAIKFLLHHTVDQKMKDSFLNEAKICALLGNKSINIVKVIDYGLWNGDSPYYVMEYLSGQSLKQIIETCSITLDQFSEIIRQICIGLEAAHQGVEFNGSISPIIHRDIKPANIFISPDPLIGQLVKILDFGIAKFFSDHSCMTQTNTFIGTLAYSSPEQIEGTNIDDRSDIYSLGIMMYEMLTQRFPWDLKSASFGAWYKAHHYQKPLPLRGNSCKIEIPQALEDLIFSCLEKDPKNRPQSVRSIICSLQDIKVLKEPDFSTARHGFHASRKHSKNFHKKPEKAARDISKTYQFASETQYFNTTKPKESLTSIKKVSKPIEIPKTRLDPEEDKLCWKTLWPKTKPIAEIVFPNLVKNYDHSIVLPSLWVMFSEDKIKRYLNSAIYNHFIFSASPYPIVLWITAIYRSDVGVKFLPCYLNITEPNIQSFVKRLMYKQYYSLLFFGLEKVHSCQCVRKVNISVRQCELLDTWIQSLNDVVPESLTKKSEQISKEILKREYNILKVKITQKFESMLKQAATASPPTETGVHENQTQLSGFVWA